MRAPSFLLSLVLLGASLQAYAFERPFPQTAKRGTLSMKNYPTVAMDGKERRLSVGAWIKNVNNSIDMPVSLRGREYTVNYTENLQGEINRVWILSPEEVKATPPNKRTGNQFIVPTTNQP